MRLAGGPNPAAFLRIILIHIGNRHRRQMPLIAYPPWPSSTGMAARVRQQGHGRRLDARQRTPRLARSTGRIMAAGNRAPRPNPPKAASIAQNGPPRRVRDAGQGKEAQGADLARRTPCRWRSVGIAA